MLLPREIFCFISCAPFDFCWENKKRGAVFTFRDPSESSETLKTAPLTLCQRSLRQLFPVPVYDFRGWDIVGQVGGSIDAGLQLQRGRGPACAVQLGHSTPFCPVGLKYLYKKCQRADYPPHGQGPAVPLALAYKPRNASSLRTWRGGRQFP